MGQPPIRGLERQRDIAALFDKGRRPFGGAPILSWPWRGEWGVRVPLFNAAQPTARRTVVLYNRLDVKDAECGPVPVVVKINAAKHTGASCTDYREVVISKVVRRLVARGALVNAAAPLYVTGLPNADNPQNDILNVLLGSTGTLPPAIAAAFKKANVPAHGVVLVSFAAVRNCPPLPAPAVPISDPFGAYMSAAFPNFFARHDNLHHLLEALEKALWPVNGASPTLRAHAAVLLRSILAQLALAYTTVAQAGVQHLDGHFGNVLIAPSAHFDIVAETGPDRSVRVPVRGCLVQVFDWDWSVKWPTPVNDQVLGIAALGDTVRCMSTPPDKSGFVLDHQRRVGNSDWARVLLSLAGRFPRCFALCAATGIAQRAFGDAATTAARSSGLSLTFKQNKGRMPYEHGFLAIGTVNDSRPCTDHAQVQTALAALPLLCESCPDLDDRPARATHSVRLPFAMSGGRGETRLFDSSPATPRCPLFPDAAHRTADTGDGRSHPRKSPRTKTPSPKKPRATPTKKPKAGNGLLQRVRGWFTKN